jgi:hypothetical protein
MLLAKAMLAAAAAPLAAAHGVCNGRNSAGGDIRARSHCRFVLPLIHFTADFLTYSVPLFLKRQCDRTLGDIPWANPLPGFKGGLDNCSAACNKTAGCVGWVYQGPDAAAAPPPPGKAAGACGSSYDAKVRKTPSWPRSCANFSLL